MAVPNAQLQIWAARMEIAAIKGEDLNIGMFSHLAYLLIDAFSHYELDEMEFWDFLPCAANTASLYRCQSVLSIPRAALGASDNTNPPACASASTAHWT